jgi:hypothetical protein
MKSTPPSFLSTRAEFGKPRKKWKEYFERLIIFSSTIIYEETVSTQQASHHMNEKGMWVFEKSKHLKPNLWITDFCSIVSRCNTSNKYLSEYKVKWDLLISETLDLLFCK